MIAPTQSGLLKGGHMHMSHSQTGPAYQSTVHRVSTVWLMVPVTWLLSSDTLLCAEGLGSDHVTSWNYR